ALCVFFFQAEDGIRDLTVTGVQTCALPILPPQKTLLFKTIISFVGLENGVINPESSVFCGGSYTMGNHRWRCDKPQGHGSLDLRSEERRVGKETHDRLLRDM